MIEYKFKKFKNASVKSKTKISISSGGHNISFSSAITELYNLQKNCFGIIDYDEQNRTIGFECTNNTGRDTLILIKSKNKELYQFLYR